MTETLFILIVIWTNMNQNNIALGSAGPFKTIDACEKAASAISYTYRVKHHVCVADR